MSPSPLENFWVFEGPQMQFGATFWANFKENYCKFLTFFIQETNKGFLALDLGGSIL